MNNYQKSVPPLVSEDHYCAGCDFRYSDTSVIDCVNRLDKVPDWVRSIAMSVTDRVRRARRADQKWSITEYLCHLRDVYTVHTIRLYRVRTEHPPVLEPMLNNLRAQRFAYNTMRSEFVLDELGKAVNGFLAEIQTNTGGDWTRVRPACRVKNEPHCGWSGRRRTRANTTAGTSHDCPSAKDRCSFRAQERRRLGYL
ncbi:MAG: DinB family protein [Mycobacteriales bacterium]